MTTTRIRTTLRPGYDVPHPCRCGHDEGAHLWAGAHTDCRAPLCRCLVYQREDTTMTTRTDIEEHATTECARLHAEDRRNGTLRECDCDCDLCHDDGAEPRR